MKIKKGFSWAGCSGTEYQLMEIWLNKGFEELYCTAPYYWGLYNEETLQIFSYTEGDTCLVTCDNKEEFIKQKKEHEECAKNQ